MSVETPGNGKSAFERRKQQALERRKVPSNPVDTIILKDLSAKPVASPDKAPGAKEIPDAEKRYFTVTPFDKIAKAPDGGDYVIDPTADPSAPDVFEFEGNILRPVNSAESDYINTVTADSSLRRAKGPSSLFTLRDTPGKTPTQPDTTDIPTKSPGSTDAPKDSMPEPEPKVEDAPKEPDEKLSADGIKAAVKVFNERLKLIQDNLLKIKDDETIGRLSADFYAEKDRFEDDLRSRKPLTKADVERISNFLTDLESKIEKAPKRAGGEDPKATSGSESLSETFEEKKARIQGIFDHLKNMGMVTNPDFQRRVQDGIDNAKTDRDLEEVDGHLHPNPRWSLPQDDGTQSAQDNGARNQGSQGPRNGPRRPDIDPQDPPPIQKIQPRRPFSMLHPENASRFETPTMDVIFQDRKKRELFGELLHHSGRQDLIDTYMNNPAEMSDDDQEALKKFREDFGRKYAFAQEAAANVNKEDIAYMLANNNFGLFGQSIEAGRASEMIKDYVYMLFMREQDETVQDLIFAQRQLREIRESEEYVRTKERVGEYLKRNKMTPDEVDTAAKEKKGIETVRSMLRGGFLDRILGDGQMKRSTMMLHEIRDHLETIGDILSKSISKDKTFVNNAIREARSGKKAPEVGSTEPATYADMETEERATQTEFNADTLRKEIKNPQSAFRKGFEAKVGKKWEAASPDEREEAFFSSYESRASEKTPHRGLFRSFLAGLFKMLLARRRTELKKEFES